MYKLSSGKTLKTVSTISYQLFISPKDKPSKTMKNVFISSKKLLSFSRYAIFLYIRLLLFFSQSAIALEVDQR